MIDKTLTIYDFCPHLINDKIDNEIWDVDFQHSKKHDNINALWDVHFEQSKTST